MLTMRVELWPFGDESAAKRLVTINLANVGQSMSREGHDYIWTIDEPTPLYGEPIKAEGLIQNYDRKASCVDMLGAIMEDYRNPVVTGLTEYDKSIVARLRDKTIKKP